MKHQSDARRIARILVMMRLVLIRSTVADMRDQPSVKRQQDGILDGLATGLPRALRTESALQHYVGWPARRTIERYGLITLAETWGYRP